MSNLVAARPAAGTALLLGTLVLLLGPSLSTPAHAIPEAASGLAATSAPSAALALREVALEQQVDRREQALTAMFAVAERHARVEQVRTERLRALGYAGDLAALERILPLGGDDYHLSAGFGAAGPLWASVHTGLDFGAASGTELVAVGDATVTEVADAGPYGLRTVLTLEDGTDLWYCHQLTSFVSPGQSVEIGELIGLVGSTGNSTGPHLHLEVHPAGGTATDPAAWLAAAGTAP